MSNIFYMQDINWINFRLLHPDLSKVIVSMLINMKN